MAIKQKLARKAVTSTAKHTAHGTISKLRRDPPRAVTLVGLGVVVGALVGWLLGRGTAGSGAEVAGLGEETSPTLAPTIPPAAASVSGAVS